MILYLAIGDFIQGLATSGSLGLIDHVPQFGETLCIYQAVVFQIGNMTSAMASFYIGIFVWLYVHFLHLNWVPLPEKKFEIITVCSVFGLPIIFCVIGEIKALILDIPIYTPVGFRSWCWISEQYPIERLMLHYTWILLICFILFCLYIHIFITLSKDTNIASSGGEDKERIERKALAQSMLGFPIIFFCAFVPLSLERGISALSGGAIKLPVQYVAFAVCTFVLNGFMNAMLYGFTRKLFKLVPDSFKGLPLDEPPFQKL